MRSKSGFSFFSKITSSKRKLSISLPNMNFVSSDINRTIDNAAEIIEKWNIEYVSDTKYYSLFSESKREARKFVKRVKDLQAAMDLIIRDDPNSENLHRAQKLMQIAMKRLQKEFFQILSMNRAHLDPESVSTSPRSNGDHDWHDSRSAKDSIIEVEEVSKSSRADLKSIADCMIAAGYSKECTHTYKSIRKSIVDESIYRLGVEKVSSAKVKKMPSEVVELKMKSWNEAVQVSMKTLFDTEKKLCDDVFESSVSLRDSCFGEISKEGALLLFGFPEIVAVKDKKIPHPEKIFPFLDMYRTLANNLPEIESVFSYKSTSGVRSQVLTSLSKLGEAILSHLMEFESEIREDASKMVVYGGGVHPMTISSMDYICRLAEYSNPLMEILNETSSSTKSLLPISYLNELDSDGSQASELRIRLAWLILVLLCKIDAKAELYKEFSMQYLFLANNLQHVVSRVRSMHLKQLLGEDWIAKHCERVKQFASSYERLAWGPIASLCPTISEAAEMSPEEAKVKFERFIESFERICASESACIVPNTDLLEEMKISIGKRLLPVYCDFYNEHINGAGKNAEWNVKYTPEDIKKQLSGLFSGKGMSENPDVCSSNISLVKSPSKSGSGRKMRSLSCRRC